MTVCWKGPGRGEMYEYLGQGRYDCSVTNRWGEQGERSGGEGMVIRISGKSHVPFAKHKLLYQRSTCWCMRSGTSDDNHYFTDQAFVDDLPVPD